MTDFAARIVDANLEEELGAAFGRYAKATILDRAIPDVRDGLKPVQRRIVYAMYEANNTPTNRYRKCAKTVGEVMGNYHPHGDQSIYDAMVRLAQDWKMRAPLVDGHGNFGSLDDDPPAAMRYTEARLDAIAIELVRDIEKSTVTFQSNFDDSDSEPTVLPARFPNLLVNGTSGVSTGFATEIQPHNMGEVIDGVLALISDPEIDLDGLMAHIPGPDFPTGGIMVGMDGLRAAYETGKGRVVLRARTAIESQRDNRFQIVITEIPYGVVKSNLVREMERMRTDKIVQGIRDVRDESDREGLRIVVDLRRGVDAESVLAFLFKKTSLQVYRHFQMVAICERSPRQLGLKEILEAYLAHQQDVVTRRSRHDLLRARARLHILEGLMRALDLLDEVIAVIRASRDRKDAHARLMERFGFSDEQTTAILDLRLHRLTNLQILDLRQEAAQLRREIARLEGILNSADVLLETIREELLAVKAAHADARRTTIQLTVEKLEAKIDLTVTVKPQEVVIGLSRAGYIKRSSLMSFEKTGANAESSGVVDDDAIQWLLQTNTLHRLVLFSAQGKAYSIPVHQRPEARWGDVGTALINVVGLEKDDRIVGAMTIETFDEESLVALLTRNGAMKRTRLKEFDAQRSTGIGAQKLTDGDEVVRVLRCGEEGDFLIVTLEGNCIRFAVDQVSKQGRSAGGVRAIRLNSRDGVVDAIVVESSDVSAEVGIITVEGRAKQTPLSEYPRQHRGGRGVRCVRKRQRLPHRVACVVCWPTSRAATEELRLILSDYSERTLPAASMRGAARDGNGYEFAELPASIKVIAARLLERDPGPAEGGDEVIVAESEGPPADSPEAAAEVDEAAPSARGGWAQDPVQLLIIDEEDEQEGAEKE